MMTKTPEITHFTTVPDAGSQSHDFSRVKMNTSLLLLCISLLLCPTCCVSLFRVLMRSLYLFQVCTVIESTAGASKEEDSGPSHPPGARTPSHPVTSEPEKAAERPLSSECSQDTTLCHPYFWWLNIILSGLF